MHAALKRSQDEEVCAVSLKSTTKSACRWEELGDQSGNCRLSVDGRTYTRSPMKASQTQNR